MVVAVRAKNEGRAWSVGVVGNAAEVFPALLERHQAGDLLLHEIGRRLQFSAQPGDLIARLGGDEFAVVMNDATDASRVERLAQRIIERVGTEIGY